MLIFKSVTGKFYYKSRHILIILNLIVLYYSDFVILKFWSYMNFINLMCMIWIVDTRNKLMFFIWNLILVQSRFLGTTYIHLVQSTFLVQRHINLDTINYSYRKHHRVEYWSWDPYWVAFWYAFTLRKAMHFNNSICFTNYVSPGVDCTG